MKIKWFLISFIIWCFIELSIMVFVGKKLNALPILLLIILTGYLGIRLIKKNNLKDFLVHLKEVGINGDIASSVTERLLWLLAAILLFLPGLLGDVIGFLLLLPPIRKMIARLSVPLIQKAPGNFMKFGMTNHHNGGFQSQYASYFSEFTAAAHGKPSSYTTANEDVVIDADEVEKKHIIE